MNRESTTRENVVLPDCYAGTDPFLSLGPPTGAALNLAVGTELGRFCIRRKMGEGRLGEVYQASDTVRGCDVAIKVARTAPPGATGLASLLKHEKAMYDRVHDNQHVLKVNDVFLIPYGGLELLVLSMEYADGGTLRDWLQEHRQDWSTRRRLGSSLIRQICLGVAALHEAGVGHLDLKPSNFLFVGGVLKVADLGASVFLTTDDLPAALPVRSSRSSFEVGTACYNSPEHFRAGPEDLDERSDIYSLGILIYEILSPRGRPPFRGDYERLRELHTSVPAPALEGGTETQARVVRRCLEKDPSKRYQTVRELLDDLEGTEALHEENPATARVEALWADICASLEQGWLTCARAACRRLLKLDPGHEDAREMSEQLDERFEHAGRIYATIEGKIDSSGLEELIQLACAATERYPGHPAAATVLIQLEGKATRYSVSMEEGLRALAHSDWEGAKDAFERARNGNPGSPAADRAVRFATGIVEQIQESRRLMDVAVASGAFTQARQLADDLDEYLLTRRNEAISFLAEIERTGPPGSAGRNQGPHCPWDRTRMAPLEQGRLNCPGVPAGNQRINN